MISPRALVTLVLLGTTIITSALPTEDISGRNILVDERSIEKAEGGTLSISVSKAATAVSCPATNNGPNRNYALQKYTAAQVKAAMLAGAKLGAVGKTLGTNDYPHFFGNKENIPFDCGKNKQEWPIQTDGKAWSGGDVDAIPDRVVYEYKADDKNYIVSFCGVMRHGPAQPFLKCT